jgi:hypothetical protein
LKPSTKPTLRYDIKRGELNGIGYTSNASEFQPFGPASAFRTREEYATLQWDGYGLGIELDAQGVVSFELNFVPGKFLVLGPSAACNELIVDLEGSVLTVFRHTSGEALDSFLGPAYDRFELEGHGLCSQYTSQGTHLIALHSQKGELLRLDISEAAAVDEPGPNNSSKPTPLRGAA